jgi:phage tail-like protein
VIDQPASTYLSYLPAIFQEDPFVGRFLLAFEAILTGSGDGDRPSLEVTIGSLADYFDPRTTPEGFLPWLAGWVALSLRADWDVDTKRAFIQEVVREYRRRGTKDGLQRMLEIYTREAVTVYDSFEQPAHFFQVQLTLSDPSPERLRRIQEIARAIIDREKPAHTFYALRVVVPTMRLVSEALRHQEGDRPPLLVLGENTLLGTSTGS